VITASEVAKLVAEPRAADEERLKFGKIFEECFTAAAWLYDRTGARTARNFARKIAAELRAAGIYSKENVARAYRIYSCLLRARAKEGRKPKTRIRRIPGTDIFVLAQPDLLTYGGEWVEFKTHPIDAYARAQARIFSWVIKAPVRLIGVVENRGYYDYEAEEIDASGLPPGEVFPEIPADLGRREEACEECGSR